LTLGGVSGIRSTRAPTASKTALAIAAPTTMIAGSPPKKGRSSS
jgi:hypothetical protein